MLIHLQNIQQMKQKQLRQAINYMAYIAVTAEQHHLVNHSIVWSA